MVRGIVFMLSVQNIVQPNAFQPVDTRRVYEPIKARIQNEPGTKGTKFPFSTPASSLEGQLVNADDFEIRIETFDIFFKFKIDDIQWSLDKNEIVFKLNHANHLFVEVKLNGSWGTDPEQTFHLEDFSLNLEKELDTPLSVFVASSFRAMLALSNKVHIRIPSLQYDIWSSFELPIAAIQKLLEMRQIAERLMVIETVFNTRLFLPPNDIKAADVEAIAFSYHALVEREFDWRAKDITFFPTASEEYQYFVPEKDEVFKLRFPTQNQEKTIFGKAINLGQFYIEIRRARIANYEKAQKEMLSLNQKPVEMVIHPEDAKIRYVAINTPQFDWRRWPVEVQMLIVLKSKLTDILLERYFKAVSSTLEGLSEAEIAEVTKRPKGIVPRTI